MWRWRSPRKVALAFVAACNARDAAALAGILHPDIVFQDSRGGRLVGAGEVLAALARVNSVAPDLRVEIDKAIERGDVVLLAGRSVTANPDLATDTQWSARVRGGKLVQWEAYGRPSPGSLVRILKAPEDGGDAG